MPLFFSKENWCRAYNFRRSFRILLQLPRALGERRRLVILEEMGISIFRQVRLGDIFSWDSGRLVQRRRVTHSYGEQIVIEKLMGAGG
jgi:hypothetical protein